MATRREFLAGSVAAAAATAALDGAGMRHAAAQPTTGAIWDAGQVVHLLPTVSHDRMLIKVSFRAPLPSAPVLSAGSQRVNGVRSDTAGLFWQFHLADLRPGTSFRLELTGDGGALCEPWTLSTFPAPEDQPQRLRLLVYSCGGGHDIFAEAHTGVQFLPAVVRQRLLRRGLAFEPDALIANGDQVYWDLFAPRAAPRLGAHPAAVRYAGRFERNAPLLGSANEGVLLRAAGPQIVPLYGTLCRSVPVFFLQDDHDHFDNDEATDEAVTFPPDYFMLQAARATQHLYYPEFLPDAARPAGLPGSDAVDRPAWRPSGLSESFGTLRYGRLVEVLLYDVRRTMTLAGPTAVFVAPEVEAWIKARAAAREVAHLINVPSNPPGWSAGKWGEWYPDILGQDGKLTTAIPKPYWQPGWLAQHDRLMQALSAMPDRVPLVVSGDLHATAEGRMLRSGRYDFSGHPVVTVLPGTLGTSDGGWASQFRGVGPLPSRHLQMDEAVPPIEENGFTLIDIMPEAVTLRYFRWNQKTQPVEAIDRLEPFHTTELRRG